MHHAVVPLPLTVGSRNVTALRLPPARNVGQNRLHVFALSLALPASRSPRQQYPTLRVRSMHTTSRWTGLPDGRKAQSIKVILENASPSSLIAQHDSWLRSALTISFDGLPAGFDVVRVGEALRLMPGDSRAVEILVAPNGAGAGIIAGWDGVVQVIGSFADGQHVDLGQNTIVGPLVRDWEAFYKDPQVGETCSPPLILPLLTALHSSISPFTQARLGSTTPNSASSSIGACSASPPGRRADVTQSGISASPLVAIVPKLRKVIAHANNLIDRYWLHEDAEQKSDSELFSSSTSRLSTTSAEPFLQPGDTT